MKMIIQPEQAGCLKTAVSVAVIHDRSLNIWSGDDGNSAAADYDIILFSFGLLSCRVHVHGAFLRDFWQSRDLCAEVCVCVGNVSPFSPSSYKRIIFFTEREITKWDWCFQLVLLFHLWDHTHIYSNPKCFI